MSFTMGIFRELKTERTDLVVSRAGRENPLSLHLQKTKDLKKEGRDVRSYSHVWKDGLKNCVEWEAWMCFVVEQLWEDLCEHLSCCWVLTLNPKPFECLMKWALCSKCCSDLLIFDGRNQSLSKFMWPILNTFGEYMWWGQEISHGSSH